MRFMKMSAINFFGGSRKVREVNVRLNCVTLGCWPGIFLLFIHISGSIATLKVSEGI